MRLRSAWVVTALLRGSACRALDPAQRTPQFGALTVDGAFEITHLVPGRYSLRAFQQGLGWVAMGGAQATVLDGQSVEVDLTLTRVRR